MKTLFVTIEEFVSKGGKLEIGRMIYREERRHFNTDLFESNEPLNNNLVLGEYIGFDQKQVAYLIKNDTFKSFPISGLIGYVKLNAKPVYS